MKIKVAVFWGGRSVEHEISVISALQSVYALDNLKYEIIPVYITKEGEWFTGEYLLEVKNYKDIPTLIKKCNKVWFSPEPNDSALYIRGFLGKPKILADIDVVFPVLHGSYGEDGALQGLLELKDIPYVGCDVLSSAIGMDKIIMKKVLKESGLPVVDYLWFTDKNWLDSENDVLANVEKLGFPVIVKPANLGSSVGIAKAANLEELKDAMNNAIKYSRRIIIENLVSDLREINCSVLGDAENCEASALEEPVRSGDFLSYTDKYASKGGKGKGMSGTQRKIPADLDPKLAQEIKSFAKNTFSVLGCCGVSRIDFLMDGTTNKVSVNEINTIPGSLSFYLWEASGVNFTELTTKLINLALKQSREKNNLVHSYTGNIFSMQGGPSLKLGKGK